MNIEAGRSKIRLKKVRLVHRPARAGRCQLIAQFRAANHDIAAKRYMQAVRQMFLQLFARATGDHHGRDVHRAAGRAHRDRWPTLVVDHDHRHRAGVHCALDFIEEKTDTAIDHRDVTLDSHSVFQVFAGLRRIGVNHPASDLPGNLKFLGECRFNRLVKIADHRRVCDLDAVVLDAVVHRVGDGDLAVVVRHQRVKIVPAVPSRPHHDTTQLEQAGGGVVLEFRVGVRVAQRQVYHVEPVAQVAVRVRVGRPFHRVHRQAGGALATEHLQRVQLGFRRHAGADQELVHIQFLPVTARVRHTVGQYAHSRRDAGHVRAVAVLLAVERITVRTRSLCAIVLVAGEVIATDHLLGGKCAGLDTRWVVLGVVRHVATPGEHRMVVVDAGVDDANAHPLASGGELAAVPDFRRADERHARRCQRVKLRHRTDIDDAIESSKALQMGRRQAHL